MRRVSVLLTLRVDGPPQVKERPRVVRGRAYTPRTTSDAETSIAWQARQIIRRPLSDPVAVSITFRLPDRRRRDLDNLAKTVLDALNGVAWADDSQIHTLHLRKTIDRADPCTLIRVTTLEVAAA